MAQLTLPLIFAQTRAGIRRSARSAQPFTVFRTTIGMMLVAGLLSVCPVTAQTAPQLGWKLNQGEQFTLTLTQETIGSTAIDSRSNTIESRTRIEFDWNVTGVDVDGTATIEQSITAISVDVNDPKVPAQGIRYDTNSEEKPARNSRAMLKQAKSLLGLTFIVAITRQGKIQSVKLPKTTETRIDALPEALMLKALFSPQGMKEILNNSQVVFPQTEQREWQSNSVKSTAFGKLNRTTTFKLGDPQESKGSAVVKVDINATVRAATGEMQPEALPAGVIAVSADKSEKLKRLESSGTILFDVSAGRLTESSTQSLIETEREYREKTIATSVKTKVATTLVKKE